MFKKSAPVLLLGTLLIVMPTVSMAQGKGADKGNSTVVPTAGSSGNVSPESLTERYTPMAGSKANAQSLVNGLRNGSDITLAAIVSTMVANGCEKTETRAVTMTIKGPTGTMTVPVMDPATGKPKMETYSVKYDCIKETEVKETFGSPTGNMGLGNVDIALALTDALLTQQNIKKPATPGQLKTALVGSSGILTLRAKNMGWGDIAKEFGFEVK